MLLPVIMAGGSGTRLWPLSRKSYPKQFLTLYGNQTMLQSTIERLETLEHHPPIIVCNEEHRFTVAEQLRNIDANSSGIILEPIAKSTAPSIALAAFEAIKNGDDPLLLVLPADHVIKDPQLFADAVNQAKPYAELGKLVTFGVIPSSAETGYGYIKKGAVFKTDLDVNNKSEKHISNSNLFEVARFVEKPDLETANQYLASQEYLWNSGIFLFKASEYLNELNRYQPDIFSVCQLAGQQAEKDADFIRVKKDIFATCPNDSIDYAVMEKTQNALVIPINCEWNDVGSWRFLWHILEKNEQQNAIRGDVIAHKTENCLVYAENKLVTTIGLNNVAIVETKDAILIADFSEVQNVKNIVDELKTQNRDELKQHREVIRPWGKFDALDIGNRFQVKRITVNPGEKLSLQMHHHRAEHWIVVTGTAKVINGDAEILVSENESTYIPIGAIHALENPGKVPLELIEVQSGSYLGEDDIVRLEDRYGRV